ncbi:GNAT family N-acetyltransferase [Embleya scabrispora]|uniref:GNAT family N-acetyltransferase n=1 Tax=Embleya scabrispora TaxID=159449 RepID=UPI000377D598|nr:GNAT family N-acetyltransferase [Embleya scabrispora]MYS80650.1 GNAT family N-acetyltransferase [Streptomyces sp. SID5474]
MTSSSEASAYILPTEIRVQGHGLWLREWTDDDVPAMVELFDEPEIDRWTPLASPFDAETARAYLKRARGARALNRGIQLAITVDGGEPCGEVLLFVDTDGPDIDLGSDAARPTRVGEIAYGIGARHRRQGLAGRSVRLMTEYARAELGADAVILRIAPENAPSIAVARATGFHRTDARPVTRERADGQVVLDTWLHHA